ncbi:MAG: phosphatase PAP2 family protein [Acidobacteriota bacterium]|nr:phosphatase PAP2 family protein [Acidobacteriota bacterium]
MRISEFIVCGFFVYLLVLSRVFPLPAPRRNRILVIGSVCIGLVIVLSQLRLQLPMRVTRDWIPGVYLLQGYWMCGLFFERPMRAVEARLLKLDRWCLDRMRLPVLVRHAPRVALELIELAYLSTYPLVPATLGLVYAAGAENQVDRYWTTVLLAAFACYGLLPWVQTRPPRSIEGSGPVDERGLWLRKLNQVVLDRASVQVNTLPSGHVATALAAALATGEVLPAQLPWLLTLATAITISTVVGRYHYTIDTVLGVGTGIVAWRLARAIT